MKCDHCQRTVEERESFLEIESSRHGSIGIICEPCQVKDIEGVLSTFKRIIASLNGNTRCPYCSSENTEFNEAEDINFYLSWLRCRDCGQRKILQDIKKDGGDDGIQDQLPGMD